MSSTFGIPCTVGVLGGDRPGESDIEIEFAGHPPLPSEYIEYFRKAAKLHDEAIETNNSKYYIEALKYYNKLAAVPWQGKYINLHKWSVVVTNNLYLVHQALGNGELSLQFKVRRDELEQQRQQ